MGETASFRQLVNNVPVLLSEIRQKASTPSPWIPVSPAHFTSFICLVSSLFKVKSGGKEEQLIVKVVTHTHTN